MLDESKSSDFKILLKIKEKDKVVRKDLGLYRYETTKMKVI